MDAVTMTTMSPPVARPLPPVLGRLLSGTFWLALRTPLQALFAFWSVPLIIGAIGDGYGAFGFAWGFGFLQFLLEFGMSSALQRQVCETWTRGDRQGVDRAIASGLAFYAAMAVLQAGVLVGIAYLAVPATFGAASTRLIVRLLWLQAVTAPCYGLSMVFSSVLQAARRYDFLPKFEMAIVIVRFAILWGGLRAGADFFAVVVAQTVAQVALSLGPALWVMVRELGYVPRFRRVGRADFAPLLHISFYMFLIQLSVVLADKIDTTVLGFALADPEPGIKAYQVVSKPFLQVRQTGWMLAYLVLPAVASLVAARDLKGLERVKYDGPRLHIGLLLPVALLAWIYAAPFLELWVGPAFPGQVPWLAGLLRLFLVATLPLVIAVHVQAAIGMGQIEVIALAALGGALINLPISYLLTTWIGVAGVIWGTVLTTLVSNLLVPGVHVFRVLEMRPATFLRRTLSAPLAGAIALVATTWALRAIVAADPRGTDILSRSLPLVAHLSAGCLAYLAGYLAAPVGRSDLAALLRRLRPQKRMREEG
jgi:O-antigen/teichoic acid export membrane protein